MEILKQVQDDEFKDTGSTSTGSVWQRVRDGKPVSHEMWDWTSGAFREAL